MNQMRLVCELVKLVQKDYLIKAEEIRNVCKYIQYDTVGQAHLPTARLGFTRGLRPREKSCGGKMGKPGQLLYMTWNIANPETYD